MAVPVPVLAMLDLLERTQLEIGSLKDLKCYTTAKANCQKTEQGLEPA